MSKLEFSRYHTSSLRSFAMRDFNLRETEINQHYWSFVASSEHSAYRARKFKKVNPRTPSTRIFKSSGANAPRVPSTVTDWLIANDDLRNWLRQSVLVSAASNLEMYLGHVARTALASDPLVRHGNPRALDGVCLMKGGIELPYEDVSEDLTKGDWNSRESKIGRYFGIGLLDIHLRKPELEQIRKFRNEFAHGFGRSLEIPEPGVMARGKAYRLTESTLKSYLGVISSIAKSVDRHLMHNHIGSFELIKYYHTNIGLINKEAQKKNQAFEDCLKLHLYKNFGLTVPRKFCKELIAFYDHCDPTFPL